jgi:acetyltransferase
MRENVEAVRDAVVRCQQKRGIAKPTYICWVAGSEGAANQALLQEAGIPVYEWPERTARTAAAIADYAERKRTGATRQMALEPPTAEARTRASSIIAEARAQGRTILLESEVKTLMHVYGASIPAETLCANPAEAQEVAQMLGGPCVLKIVSTDISHKSDVGGVRIGVSAADVGVAFEEMMADVRAKQPTAHILGISVQELVHGQEVIIGGLHDAEFGPMVLFGLGGIFVEILRDVASRLVPASTGELHTMIQEVRGYPLLEGARGRVAVDVEAIIQTLQAAAWLLIEFPEMRELDLNPVIVGAQGAIVADGRAVLAVQT